MAKEIKKIKSLLKQIVRDKKYSYDSLSADLGVSPATVKRMLNSEDLSIGTLVELCAVLDINFYELVEQSRERISEASHFTTTQEKYLANNFAAFLLLREFVARRTLKDACRELNLNLKEGREYLAEMDKVGLIEWHSNDRVKLLVDFPFKWIKGGSLENAYSVKVIASFFEKAKKIGLENEESSEFLCRPMELSLKPADSKKFKNELNTLVQKYMSISEYELKFSKGALNIFSAFVLAGPFSPWEKEIMVRK